MLVGGKEEQEWRCVLYLENVGRGVGVVTQIWLESLSGRRYKSSSGPTVAPGSHESLVLVLTETQGDGPPLRKAWLSTATKDQCAKLEEQWDSLPHDRVYLLEIHYDDVFDEPADYVCRAWFDPYQFGAWRTFEPLSSSLVAASGDGG